MGKLSILHDVYGEFIIPEAVYKEITSKPDSICNLELQKNEDWFSVVKIQNEFAKDLFKSQLHEGEVEVMILAKETSADLVIIDDANAKKHAKYLGLTVTGTLGALLKAKELKIIPEIKPLLMEMRRNHMFVTMNQTTVSSMLMNLPECMDMCSMGSFICITQTSYDF